MKVAQIWRHPIKAVGAEQSASAVFRSGVGMEGDRVWALTHEKSKYDGSEWAICMNFLRGASCPQLMAVTAETVAGGLRLSHPAQGEITLDPAGNTSAFLDWVRPLVAPREPVALMPAPGRALTDSHIANITIGNLASLDALSERVGQPLDRRRFRANIWIEGAEAWSEYGWAGRDATLGAAKLRIYEPVSRCRATEANPETGERDADTLGALAQNDQQFCMKAEILEDGEVRLGDHLALL
ncbi:MOSC domain-containing protein [Paracoccaceae bacterium GXU_MW_L88]